MDCVIDLAPPDEGGRNSQMDGPSRRRIFGDRVGGAKIGPEHARKRAREAIREAGAAECPLWSEQMAGFGGPGAAIADDRAMFEQRLRQA
jgi:hypothetical protein